MGILDFLAAVTALDEVGDQVHRTRTIERDERGDVLDGLDLKLFAEVAHAAGFQLKHAQRLGVVQQLIGLGVIKRQCFQIQGQALGALHQLDGLFTRSGLWSELAENLETQLGLADTDESQLALMLRLAALREGEMKQVEAAIEGYRQVLDRDPTNQAALGALERQIDELVYALYGPMPEEIRIVESAAK